MKRKVSVAERLPVYNQHRCFSVCSPDKLTAKGRLQCMLLPINKYLSTAKCHMLMFLLVFIGMASMAINLLFREGPFLQGFAIHVIVHNALRAYSVCLSC